jgi:hypothetical protein
MDIAIMLARIDLVMLPSAVMARAVAIARRFTDP